MWQALLILGRAHGRRAHVVGAGPRPQCPLAVRRGTSGRRPHLAFLLIPVFIAAAAVLALRLGRTLRLPPAAVPPVDTRTEGTATPAVEAAA